MLRTPIIQSDQSYTFSDYFKLNFAPQDILAYFGVTLQRRALTLTRYTGELDRLTDLKARIEESLPRLSLTSEMARREFLIAPFDTQNKYQQARTKKNLIIGFTATPDDHTLARFGEFSGYAESEKLWVPFDSYTMNEAIKDGFILNPLKNVVPAASKLLFDLPSNELEGSAEPRYRDADKKKLRKSRSN